MLHPVCAYKLNQIYNGIKVGEKRENMTAPLTWKKLCILILKRARLAGLLKTQGNMKDQGTKNNQNARALAEE